MPVLQADNISYQFDNGDRLFESLSLAIKSQRIGLVGRNGVGKSILAAILSGALPPSSGTITRAKSMAIYRQQPSHLLASDLSIAQFLGQADVLEALKHVESGDCSAHWFDVIGEQWDLPQQLTQQLNAIGLPADPHFACAKLSGGQLARLQLWQLLSSPLELLILDEPSNHLDGAAKQWLLEAMRAFKGAILLISHDRLLLREMEEIWQLSSLGLQVFGGNYDVYAEQKRYESQALERQLTSLDKQQRQLVIQAQRNREKAQQRAAQGNKLRKSGSQATSLLDFQQDRATARSANRTKNQQRRQVHLETKQQSLKARKESISQQKLYLADTVNRPRHAVALFDVVLAFGCNQLINWQVKADEKVHLTGANGSGKSTLLKTLLGKLSLKQGSLQRSAPIYYLDQHFAVIVPQLSMLDNLLEQCDGMQAGEARTLLAGIGFRRECVFRLGGTLSGGEKMKLAMLIASHQPQQPLLLLDEPDNHLDLDSRIILAQALYDYRGGFILVSHDDDFATDSGVKRQIEL